jgi:hypothetical protein
MSFVRKGSPRRCLENFVMLLLSRDGTKVAEVTKIIGARAQILGTFPVLGGVELYAEQSQDLRPAEMAQ